MSRLQKLASVYDGAAHLVLGTLIALVLLNLCLYPLILTREGASSNPIYRKYGQKIAHYYPGMAEDEVNELLHESWSRQLAYSSFTEIAERPYQGRYVNVSPAGFRVGRDQGPWPPAEGNFNVFLFGGSTAFGYSVRDEETVASYLQFALAKELRKPVKVYNFGCAYYYSSQERVLFQLLLGRGLRPDLAVFLDGLNDFLYDDDRELKHTGYLSRMVDLSYSRSALVSYAVVYGLPMGRAALFLREQLGMVPDRPARASDAERSSRIIDRYFANRKMTGAVADAFSVPAFFVWQPISFYEFDRRDDPWSEANTTHLAATGYPMMKQRLGAMPNDNRFLWLAEIQKGIHEPLYVDKYHYSARLNEMLAQRIAHAIVERKALKGTKGVSQ